MQSKDARSAIVQKLSNDFNLTPIIAESFYQQFSQYFQENTNVKLSSGEIAYEAVHASEPAAKHIQRTRIKLIDLNIEIDALANYEIAGLRRHRLARITGQLVYMAVPVDELPK